MKLTLDKNAEKIILNNDKVKIIAAGHEYYPPPDQFFPKFRKMYSSQIYSQMFDLRLNYYSKYRFLYENKIIKAFFYGVKSYNYLTIITILSNTFSFLETQRKNPLTPFNTFGEVVQINMDKLKYKN